MLEKILQVLRAKPSIKVAQVLYEYLKIHPNISVCKGELIGWLVKVMRESERGTVKMQAYELYCKALLLIARDDFDSFMLYMEKDRAYEDKFWVHRRKVLERVCNALQEIADDKLDILFIELPPRVGKSTIATWFVCWYGAKHPETSSLLVGHSSALVKSFYVESEGFISDSKYKFFEVFPELEKTVQTSALDLNINLGSDSRYKTLQYKSIDGNMSGVVEASGILICDDIITGIEEALSPERLEGKWIKLNTDVMQRCANSSVKKIFIGTPWASGDPFEQMHEIYKDDSKYRVRRVAIPATDSMGRSNFDYNSKYKIGFTSEFYRKQKETMDDVSYQALYMLQRLDREGLIFNIDRFPTFEPKDLCGRTPLSIVAYGDVAWGGGDATAMPVLCEYEDGWYLVDAVYNKEDKEHSQPVVAACIERNGCYRVIFESNNGGDGYADAVQSILRGREYSCRVEAKKSENTSNAKIVRIVRYSPEIQATHILRRECRTQEYEGFIREVCVFNQSGKNKHDDAPDSMAMAYDSTIKKRQSKVFITRRAW